MSTYEVISFRMNDLNAKLNKINNKAIKLGFDPIVIEHIASRREVYKDQESGRKEVRIYNLINITGTAPVIGGYKFIAKIQHTSSGNIISKSPGIDYDLPVEYRTCSAICDHCGIDRIRNNTFLLEKDGKIIQVGKSCLADFTRSKDPGSAISAMSLFHSIESYAEECYNGFGYSLGINTIDFLAAVNMLIRNVGWISSKNAIESGRRSTAEGAYIYCNNPKIANDHPIEKDYDLANEVIDWASNLDVKSDYENNLKVSLGLSYVDFKNRGIVASAVVVCKRELDKINAPKVVLESNYFGNVGDKIDLDLTIAMVKVLAGEYGPTTLIKFVSDTGDVFKWFASGDRDWETGVKVNVTGRIKSHTEYNGIKETTLTRCRIYEKK